MLRNYGHNEGLNSLNYVQSKFAQYYREYASEIPPPTSIEKREFGFLLFKERIMLRHKGFENVGILRSFLEKVAPSDVYRSIAYYEIPEAEMEGKGWLGADLVFDIDADHIPTPCAKIHDTWVCGNCGLEGKGPAPERCPTCDRQKFDEKTWPCEVCLASAKAEILKLLDLLTKDLGLSHREMRVFFSGHRGFHLHVESGEIRGLDAQARKEMVDYVMGVGLDPKFHGLTEMGEWRGPRVLVGPDLHDPGWRGRIARGTYDCLLAASRGELEKIGLKKIADRVVEHKEALLESWEKKGPWGIVGGIGAESWRKIVQQGIEKQSVKIDTVVTTDIHRLIRVAGTLHGKTGWKKTEMLLTGIEDFDPFKDAVAFKRGTVEVLVSEAPRFRLGDELYGPYRDQEAELPTAAALLLLCKGVARVKGEEESV